KKEVVIHPKYEEDLWPVEADRGQIEQILMNLYVNAWQSMPGGGELYLESENVFLEEKFVSPYDLKSGKYVRITVTDTGIGMDQATQDKIFDPFFTTKEMGRGTGLGLASAYGIIKNHNGIINVESDKGHGATFTLYLPASEKDVHEEKKTKPDIINGSETILLVDDEDMVIDVGQRMLNRLGYKVMTAKSGKEALQTYQMKNHSIDIVIIDMIMPLMGGGETYDRLKKIDPDLKVLLASGYSIDGQAREILDRGCDGFIQKPFDLANLSKKLREILDDRREPEPRNSETGSLN
ncbi:MAG: response regulator, partial [Deltaproteobacteria bacterium]|nr:response regulator [Deltaproteobacteria bacterium]